MCLYCDFIVYNPIFGLTLKYLQEQTLKQPPPPSQKWVLEIGIVFVNEHNFRRNDQKLIFKLFVIFS